MKDIFDFINKTQHTSIKDFAKENLTTGPNNNSQNEQNFESEKKNFKSFDEQNLKQNLDDNTIKTASDIYNKYKDFSQQDLMQEFLSQTKQRLNDGSLPKEKLEKTISSLSPMLNESQRQFLQNLLENLK